MTQTPDTLLAELSRREYPGRGLALGRDSDGAAFGAYWITGRSEASRLRSIILGEQDVVVHDLTGGPVDSLRHYTAATRDAHRVILGNGTQVRELTDAVTTGTDFQLSTRNMEYEPDPPIRTPRIVGQALLTSDLDQIVVASSGANPFQLAQSQVVSLHDSHVAPGQCLALCTYRGTVEEPQACGQPMNLAVDRPWPDLQPVLWDALNPRVRVAAMVFPLASPSFLSGLVTGIND
ncbi:MAG: IMP cyclohydrolase [Actinomycetota bacterium]